MIALDHMVNEERGEGIRAMEEKGSVADQFLLLKEQIENGEVTDPRALDTYFQLEVQFFQSLRQKAASSNETLGDARVYEGAIRETIPFRDGDEVTKIDYCLQTARNAVSSAQRARGINDTQFADLKTRIAANWLRLATARIEMPLAPGGNTINTQLTTPASRPSSGSPGK